MMALEVLRIEDHIPSNQAWFGRRRVSRKALGRAFIARAVLGIPDVNDLYDRLVIDVKLRRICGFNGNAPSKSTLCRAFADFAEDPNIREKVLEFQVRVHLGDRVVPHVSKDSTAIEVREKGAPKARKDQQPKRKRGRPRKGEFVEPKEPNRIERQLAQTWEDAVAELPKVCDIGGKFNSSGRVDYWKGYKLHVDVADGGVPLSVCLTSASTNDSQVAIPLMKMTASRVLASMCDLMDRGYDAKLIKEFSRSQGHVPLIQSRSFPNRPAILFDPAEEERFKIRTTVERFFSDLKDNHCGRSIRVKGWKKVLMHLMFGVLAIFATTVLKI
jgi:hypothetical protein